MARQANDKNMAYWRSNKWKFSLSKKYQSRLLVWNWKLLSNSETKNEVKTIVIPTTLMVRDSSSAKGETKTNKDYGFFKDQVYK